MEENISFTISTLRALGACEDALSALAQYQSLQEAWQDWCSAAQMAAYAGVCAEFSPEVRFRLARTLARFALEDVARVSEEGAELLRLVIGWGCPIQPVGEKPLARELLRRADLLERAAALSGDTAAIHASVLVAAIIEVLLVAGSTAASAYEAAQRALLLRLSLSGAETEYAPRRQQLRQELLREFPMPPEIPRAARGIVTTEEV